MIIRVISWLWSPLLESGSWEVLVPEGTHYLPSSPSNVSPALGPPRH